MARRERTLPISRLPSMNRNERASIASICRSLPRDQRRCRVKKEREAGRSVILSFREGLHAKDGRKRGAGGGGGAKEKTYRRQSEVVEHQVPLLRVHVLEQELEPARGDLQLVGRLYEVVRS